MPQELLKLSDLGEVTVVELFLPDALDSTEFDRLNEGLDDVFRDRTGGRWILDLSNVVYMGSAALGLMVYSRHRVKSQDGKLALCQMSPRLHQVFKACCLEKLFTIEKTREDAAKALR